jgi:N-acyl amino acid synthase of PEP-CTERM/exosortase system
MTTSQHSVAESFRRYLLDTLHHLRYRVYCEEFGFEKAENCPNQRETDEYDTQSVHCLVRHITTGQSAGCVRMVPTPSHDPGALLPFEKYCREALDMDYIAGLKLDRSTVCEISRLAVDGNFRRRGPEEKKTRFGQVTHIDFSPEEQRTLPLIAVSAFLAATAITEHTGRTNAFAMMEPFLPRLMARSGIPFHRAGKDIDYHGIRAPYFTTTQSSLGGMHEALKELYIAIREQLYSDSPGQKLRAAG